MSKERSQMKGTIDDENVNSNDVGGGNVFKELVFRFVHNVIFMNKSTSFVNTTATNVLMSTEMFMLTQQ